MLYNTYRNIIRANNDFNHGNYKENPNITAANMLWELFLTTPENRVKSIPHGDFSKWLKNTENKKSRDWNDSSTKSRP
ncbi:MAG TPA: hypothetical protein VIM16_17775 [Mucilaginibacter sp.]|jgi:cell division protein YceG involved in septum cleavage